MLTLVEMLPPFIHTERYLASMSRAILCSNRTRGERVGETWLAANTHFLVVLLCGLKTPKGENTELVT